MAGLYTMLAILVPMMIGSVLTLVRPTPVDLDDVNHERLATQIGRYRASVPQGQRPLRQVGSAP